MSSNFLNAFNNINFLIGGSATADVAAVGGFSSTNFDMVISAYHDVSTTNDLGGRLVLIVLHVNF